MNAYDKAIVEISDNRIMHGEFDFVLSQCFTSVKGILVVSIRIQIGLLILFSALVAIKPS